jgi:hypothetical protein
MQFYAFIFYLGKAKTNRLPTTTFQILGGERNRPGTKLFNHTENKHTVYCNLSFYTEKTKIG